MKNTLFRRGVGCTNSEGESGTIGDFETIKRIKAKYIQDFKNLYYYYYYFYLTYIFIKK